MWMIDQYWFIWFIPGLLIGLYAQFKLTSTYNHYVEVPAASGITGADAAREILSAAGLGGMPVNEVPGHLTDHYDPMKKALFLSTANFHGRSLAALGVSAHEAGHALQHKAAYTFFQFRMMMVPATRIASIAWFWLPIAGLFLGGPFFRQFITIAIAVFGVITLFQVITLPVEYDASRRAKEELSRLGLVQNNEAGGVAKVLNAAALTYVAAMVTSILQLLRLILISRNRS